MCAARSAEAKIACNLIPYSRDCCSACAQPKLDLAKCKYTSVAQRWQLRNVFFLSRAQRRKAFCLLLDDVRNNLNDNWRFRRCCVSRPSWRIKRTLTRETNVLLDAYAINFSSLPSVEKFVPSRQICFYYVHDFFAKAGHTLFTIFPAAYRFLETRQDLEVDSTRRKCQ